MRLSWLVGLLAVVLLGGSVTGAALARQPSHEDPGATSARHAPSAAEDPEKDDEEGGEQAESGDREDGHGPPAWAHGHSKHASARAKGGKGSKDWKDAWHKMTEAQRTARMEKLSKAHARGMRAWARCVEAAGEDPAQRSSCEKPLPPGLAKKQ